MKLILEKFRHSIYQNNVCMRRDCSVDVPIAKLLIVNKKCPFLKKAISLIAVLFILGTFGEMYIFLSNQVRYLTYKN